MLWCNFTWLGFMQTIVGDYSKSNKNTLPSKYATMCIILIKNSSHPEKTKYPLLNISVQWFSWSKLHSNPAHPINAPNSFHTLSNTCVFRIVTTKSPKGLKVVVGSWQKNPKPRILWSQKLFFLFQHLRTTANVGFLTTLSFELLFLSYSILVSCFTILKSESFLCCLIFVVSFRSLHKAKRYLGIHDLACSMRRSTASPWHHFSSGWEGIGIFQKLIDENWQT